MITVNAKILEVKRRHNERFRWEVSVAMDGKTITTIVASEIKYLFQVGNYYRMPLEKTDEGNFYIIHPDFKFKEKSKVPRRTAANEKAKEEVPIELDPFDQEIDVDADIESYIDESVEKEEEKALVVSEQSLDFIEQIDRDRIVAQFADYQFVMKNIVGKSDWVNIKGKLHLKKSGFIKLAVAFQISVEIVETIDLSKGEKYKYRMTAKASSQNGRSMESVGMCSSEEYLDQKNKRGEHVIFATCETRAKVRAISSLMGMGLVSADEMQ